MGVRRFSRGRGWLIVIVCRVTGVMWRSVPSGRVTVAMCGTRMRGDGPGMEAAKGNVRGMVLVGVGVGEGLDDGTEGMRERGECRDRGGSSGGQCVDQRGIGGRTGRGEGRNGKDF
ncbi:hypothetical protein A6V37_37915 [Paraburkholderia ginsengiterrae]|uniref:Uncharacterized protein n=1 Tax=Paraburkholderia ginsengiterrae TaxID=1462993 RepID=A0A1A9NCY8_9BURK|nr:hypothetical protein A6V37_37915 [Paraburkholderia ginsengiterrae]